MKAKSSQVQVRRDLYLKLKVIKTAFPEANDKRMLPQSSLWPFLGYLSDIRLPKQQGPEGRGAVYVTDDWNKDQRFPWRGCVLPLSPGSIVAGLLPSRRQSIWLFCVLAGLFLALYFSISSLKTIRRQIYIQSGKKRKLFPSLHSCFYINTGQRSQSNWQWCFHLMFPNHMYFSSVQCSTVKWRLRLGLIFGSFAEISFVEMEDLNILPLQIFLGQRTQGSQELQIPRGWNVAWDSRNNIIIFEHISQTSWEGE